MSTDITAVDELRMPHGEKSRDRDNNYDFYACVVQNLILNDDSLDEHNKLWAEVTEALPVPAFIHDERFRVLWCNDGYAELTGKDCSDLLGKYYYQIFPLLDGPVPACAAATCGNQNVVEDTEFVHDSGRVFLQRSYPLDSINKGRLGLHLLEDVTGKRRTAQDMHQNNELFECIFNTTHMAMALLDADFNFLKVNLAYAQADGSRNPEDFIGLNHFSLYPSKENESIFRKVSVSGESYRVTAKSFEYTGKPERGVSYWDWSLLPVKEPGGRVSALLLMLRDVSEKNRAKKMRDSLSAIVEATPDLVAMSSPNGDVLYMNAAGRRLLGLDENEEISRHKMSDFFPQEERTRFSKEMMSVLDDATCWTGESRVLHCSGNTIPVSQIHIARNDANNEPEFIATISRDISLEKRKEQRLRQLNRTYAVLSECGQAMVRAETENELLEDFCRNLIIVGGYHFAWIGGVEPGGSRCEKLLSWFGANREHAESANISWIDAEGECGPVVTAIRSGKQVVVNNIETEECYGPSRETALERGCRSMITVPLSIGNTLVDVLTLYAVESNAFDDEEVEVLLGLADDLSYGLDTLRTRAAQAVDRELLQLRIKAIEAARNGITITLRDGKENKLIYANKAFERITGYRREEVIGRDPRFLHGKDGEQTGLSQLRSAVRQRQPVSLLMRNYRKDGSLFWNELHVAPVACGCDDSGYFVGIINDVTVQKQYHEQLEYQATHDKLTGLPNRALLVDRLEHGIAHAQRHNIPLAVLLIDIDNFKNINDTFGYSIGNDLLREVGQRLRSCARDADTVAHLGGDEFVMLASDLADDNDAALLAERVLSTLTCPIDCVDMDLLLTASIGIAGYPRDGNDAESLLRNASTSMHNAKELNRSSFYFYTPEMNSRAQERVLLETQLRRALERDELRLYYQPQVELKSGRIVGAEALLRWDNPELGMVSPDRFIPIAERTGLIVPIGQWVLHEACRQTMAWQRAGLPVLSIAVNVSAHQLSGQGLVRDIQRVLTLTGLKPERLELELTESAVMSDPEEMMERMQELRELGLQLAIDDFGTGYSCLSYLQRFPFNRLKVDRSFITDVTSNPNNTAIVKTILAMAQALNMHVVAEGVENEGQVHLLRRLHCNQIQGFHFSRPLPAGEFTTLLREQPVFHLAQVDQSAQETILIVDDEINVINALKRNLRKDGYRILSANDPEEALDLLARHRVQVILADYRMPNMSGADFLDRVKKIYPEVIRILLTGYAEMSAIISAVNRGNVYKFMTKPWEIDELRETLHGAFEQYHRQYQRVSDKY